MRLATWNVNSVTAREPRLVEWLGATQPDVLCLQETKCSADAFPYDAVRPLGYEVAAHGDGRWNGVALLTRVGLTDVTRGLRDEPGFPAPEARAIGATCNGVRVWSVDDVWDPSRFVRSTHVTPPERAALAELRALGLQDVVPRPLKYDRPFTYWDYRAGMFHRNEGIRIDLVYASEPLADAVTDAYVDREARKGKGPSDHAPVVVDVDTSVLAPPD